MRFSISAAIALSALVFGASACPVSASTYPSTLYFYVGADYQYVWPSYKAPFNDVPNHLNVGGDAHLGLRWRDFVAVEAGYMRSLGKNTQSIKASSAATTATVITNKFHIDGPTLDLLGFLPIAVNRDFGFYGVGTVGASYLDGKDRLTIAKVHTFGGQSDFGFRGGLGIEERIGEQFGVRALVRYQSGGFGGVTNHSILGTVGFNVYF